MKTAHNGFLKGKQDSSKTGKPVEDKAKQSLKQFEKNKRNNSGTGKRDRAKRGS